MVNIIKVYVGSGVMGLPFSFMEGGLIVGTLGLIFVAVVSNHCVLMLVDCKSALDASHVKTYRDIGYQSMH